MNLDALEQENGGSPIPSYPPPSPTQNYGSPYSGSYGTNYGTGYGNSYNQPEPPLWAEFAFQGILLALAFLIPLTIFLIKKLLKSVGWLTPTVVRILDKIQTVFHKTMSKVFKRKIEKNTNGGKVAMHESTSIIVDEVGEELKTHLYVAPDEKTTEQQEHAAIYDTTHPPDDIKLP